MCFNKSDFNIKKQRHWETSEFRRRRKKVRTPYPPIAFFPANENRAAARSAGVLDGCASGEMGCGGAGSGAIGYGVMYFRRPLGGPVSALFFL